MIDRIVIINDLSTPMGGASQLAVQSARAFRQRGHAVTFISGDSGNPELEELGVECVFSGQQRLLAGNALGGFLRGLYNSKAGSLVSDWISRHDGPGTVYHLHGWSQTLSPSIFRAAAPVLDRVVMSAHDFFLTCPNGAMYDFQAGEPCALKPMSGACFARQCDRRNRGHKMWRFARHTMLNRSRGSRFPAQLLIHSGMGVYFARSGLSGRDMVTLPNPVTPYRQHRISAERNGQALFVGRIEKTKGIDLAAAACRRAGIPLIAIGDGTLLAGLRAEYPEHHWLGRKEPDQIGAIAEDARMLLMPSLHMEPFGLSAVEALWSGLPVALSAHSLLADDIVDAGAGISLDIADLEGFSAKIAALAGNDRQVLEMSEAAFGATRHLAMTPSAWTDALLAAYRGLLGGGKAGLARASAEWLAAPQPRARMGARARDVVAGGNELQPCFSTITGKPCVSM